MPPDDEGRAGEHPMQHGVALREEPDTERARTQQGDGTGHSIDREPSLEAVRRDEKSAPEAIIARLKIVADG